MFHQGDGEVSETLMQSVHAVLRAEELKAQEWRAALQKSYLDPSLRDANRKADCQMAGLVKWLADKAQELSP
jgi:hypothetical protein